MAATALCIDVLIPVHNGAPWLRQSLQSIQQQTHRALRIHVVDDGSTDDTPAILQALAAGDGRIRIHRKPNGGIVDALNHGLAHCTAPWLARHDADDIAHPQRLQRQLDYLLAHADCVAVGAAARHIDAAGAATGTTVRLPSPTLADASWLPAREPYLMHPLLLVRRAALAAAGGYRHAAHAEDSDLYWRLREHGRLHNLPDVLADYRVHGGSVSAASVHNGRLMAVGSQLAALSARRRQARQADIAFNSRGTRRLRQAATLQAMLRTAARGLDAGEREHFVLAVAAKLLELASYQPYELDAADCRCIGHAARRSRRLAVAGNRRSLAGQLTRTAVRLWQAGRRRDAATLLTPALWPAFGLRLALRSALPQAARERLHGWLQARRQAAA